MLSDVLKVLLSRVPPLTARWESAVLSCLIGLAVPLLGFLLGHIVLALSGHPPGRISANLPVLDVGLSDATRLVRVSWLLGAAGGISFVAALLLFWTYRFVQVAAVDFEISILKTYRQRIERLATFKTLSAQQTALTDDLEYHLPRVRSVLARYWQTIPRHLVQLVGCVILGMLLHVQFTLLAIIASALVVLSYRWLDRSGRVQLPIIRESASQLRNRIVNVCLRGPLMQAVHESGEIDKRFDHVLELYQKDAVRSLTNSSWKVPLAVCGLSTIVLLMVFIMSIQGLRNEFQLPAAASFLFCLFASVYSARRLVQVRREIQQIEPACNELVEFLSAPLPDVDESHLSGIHRVAERAELEFVTVQDSHGRKLLEDVSAVFETGHLVGIFASQPIQARTLAELLVGFGRPTSGRMLFDSRSIIDLKANDLIRCAHWVASDGGILTGSLAENLTTANDPHVNEAIHRAGLDDLLARLTDGLYTLVTHDDDRLLPDETFRIGLARAMLHSASMVVIEEPETIVPLEVELATLEAIKQIVHPSRIAVLLPQRLSTLRNCERILFVHEHRLVDSGSHNELVQRNELYRHLTYLKFNPFR